MTKKEFIQQMMIHMASNPEFTELDISEDEDGIPYLRALPMLEAAEGVADVLERDGYKFDEEGN